MTSPVTPRAIRSAKVLIVEDEYLVAMSLEGRLKDAGFEVVGIAASAERAYAIAAAEWPDIALMDIRLLGKADGVEAATRLHVEFRIPSIFTTAHTDEETQRRAAAAHPLAWVQKPYLADDVIHLLNEALASR